MAREAPLIAVPNVSEGADQQRIRELVGAVRAAGARVLDVHSDRVHNRSVLTVAGNDGRLVPAMTELALACRYIDLRIHRGVHPRLGGLDVCPIVPHHSSMKEAVEVARRIASSIGREASLPVYLYGKAARRSVTRDLAQLRRMGLAELAKRAKRDLPPDEGPADIDPAQGIVCVGARDVLIAFNVWLACEVEAARAIAASVRASEGGRPGLQALGFEIERGRLSQVSMNLVLPNETPIDHAFAAVAAEADARGVRVLKSEIVGLVPERYLPAPNGMAGRLLMEPARSLESALRV